MNFPTLNLIFLAQNGLKEKKNCTLSFIETIALILHKNFDFFENNFFPPLEYCDMHC